MISVCLATYNGEKYIREQLDSILCQLSDSDEVIISDDGSMDKTLDIAKAYDDDRIKIFIHNGTHGYVHNFENALSQVQGDYIFLSDQDDIWVNNKVAICMEYFKKYDMLVSDAAIVNSDAEVIAPSFFEKRKPYKTLLGNLVKFGYLGCCMAFKRKILEKSLPFPTNSQLCTHDNWLFLVGCCFFKSKILDDKLILYRRHNFNLSSGGLENRTSIWFKIHYRLYLIINLFCRI